MGRGKLAIAVVVLAVAAAGWWMYERRPSLYPLPSADVIESLVASAITTGERHPFAVPRASWQPLLDSLQPVRDDDNPAKWQGLAVLNLSLKGGDHFLVQVFRISDGPGGFALVDRQGATTYYRGGDSTETERVLKAAFKQFRNDVASN
jgi:hypothetical protein